MGTRARINVFDGNQVLVSIYRQMDGYPSGLGQEVADFTAKLKLVNGLPGDTTGLANGMGCFAAQLVAHLKNGPGNIYIRNTNEDSQGEEYVYNIKDHDGQLWITALSGRMTAFGNPGDKEAEMAPLYDGPASDFAVEEA